MKLGILTAAFPTLSLEEVSDWASKSGFEAIEIAVWPAGGKVERRYAGTAHIDVRGLGRSDAAPRIVDELAVQKPRDFLAGLLSQSARP